MMARVPFIKELRRDLVTRAVKIVTIHSTFKACQAGSTPFQQAAATSSGSWRCYGSRDALPASGKLSMLSVPACWLWLACLRRGWACLLAQALAIAALRAETENLEIISARIFLEMPLLVAFRYRRACKREETQRKAKPAMPSMCTDGGRSLRMKQASAPMSNAAEICKEWWMQGNHFSPRRLLGDSVVVVCLARGFIHMLSP